MAIAAVVVGKDREAAAIAALLRATVVDGAPGAADAGAELAVVCVPEVLDEARRLLEQLAGAVAGDCVLASTAASLPVDALAATLPRPERVLGMRFSGPPGATTVVELVAGARSGRQALERARQAILTTGARLLEVPDALGLLVPRCSRPYWLEAFQLLAERAAAASEIDRICRLHGRFPHGPLELVDAYGADRVLELDRALYEQSFGEPRWRPSPLMAARAAGAAGLDGRLDGPRHEPATEPDEAGGVVVVAGESMLADELAQAGEDAGWEVLDPESAAQAEPPRLILDLTADGGDPAMPLQGGPRAVCCSAGSLAALEQGGTAVGFNLVPPLATAGLVELTRGPDTADSAAQAAARFFGSLGLAVAWVGDGPGLVLGRIVAQLVNEAAFALGEGIGSVDAIDGAMRLVSGHPLGPLEWGDLIGLEQVLATLEALSDERRDPRYRPAPELARRVWSGRLGIATGEGFYEYA